MIIYIEKNLRNNKIAQNILQTYSAAEVLYIDNFKNIFDKNISGNTEKNIIIASVKKSILDAPLGYGHRGKGYFLKNSLNCVYSCDYCYLQGAFKNETKVFFVNYSDIKKEILYTLKHAKNNQKNTWFYSSDYSDNLATDSFTQFCENFIPFFDTLENVKMEIRTKSTNIQTLLQLETSKNIEIAFSLNPQEVIQKHEKNTPSLKKRIEAMKKLIDAGWQVGIRFMPLLEVENYEEVYEKFLDQIISELDFSKIYSVFVGGLMFTYDDYNTMLKKHPYLDVLYKLEKNSDGFYRESPDIRKFFYTLFQKKLRNKIDCNICLDDNTLFL